MERPQSHATDSRGKAQMRRIFESVGWTVNEIQYDYGVDFDVQLFDDRKATGDWFKVQLKSSEKTAYSAQGEFISEILSQQHITHFSTELREPIFIVHADVDAERTFWYAPQLDAPVNSFDPRENITIRIPTQNELPVTLPDLVAALRRIRIRLGAQTISESSVSDFANSVDYSDRERLIGGIQDKVDWLRLVEIHELMKSRSLEDAAAKADTLSENKQSSIGVRFSAILERERIDFLNARKANEPQSTTPAIHLRTAERLQQLTRKGPAALKFVALIARKAAELDTLTFQDLGLYMNLKSHVRSGDPATALHLAVESLQSTSRIVAKYNQCLRLVRYASNSEHRWALPTALTRIVESTGAFIIRLRDEGQTESAKQYTSSAFQICELAAWIADRNHDETALSHITTTVMLLAYKKQDENEIEKTITFARETLAKIKNPEQLKVTGDALDRAISRMSGEGMEDDSENDLIMRIAENRAFGLGIDMTNVSDPLVRAIRLGIADYSCERAIKHCEHAFVSISGRGIPGYVTMVANLLQLPTMCGKIIHCTLHSYNVEGRTLDTICADFKTKYCESCKDVLPRSTVWEYSEAWLEKENKRREEFMASFYEKRYKGF
jgi:Domain of unknown function (DUF4365)